MFDKTDDNLIFGNALAELYVKLRDELQRNYRGMDPNDPTRAPIAMAILTYAHADCPMEIEAFARRDLGLPNLCAGASIAAVASRTPQTQSLEN